MVVVAPNPAISVAAAPAVPGPIPTPLAASSSDLVERAIADAMTWLGVPYRWAGCTRAGVDCSCFIDNILLVGAGIRAPRVTVDQIRWATPVPAGSMRRGDLLFFHDTCTECGANPTHVAMYLGGGQFIHAGDPVQISSVTSALFREHFQAAGRPIGF
jgi:cell wall-associated NlpC family hydrolase